MSRTIDNNGLLTAFSPGVTVITYTDIEGCQATQPIVVNEIPTLTISNDTSICVGGTAQLEVDGAGVSGTYSWTPITGLNTPNGTSVNASPIVNTTYTVVGLNTATGCENFANVTVSIIPTPIMEATPDVDVCSGDTIPFINFVSTPVATEYQWTNDYPEIGIPASGIGNIGPNIIAGVNGSDTIAFAEITVIPSPRMASITFDSVALSNALVASSSKTSSGRLASDLAIETRCFCPPLSFPPPCPML